MKNNKILIAGIFVFTVLLMLSIDFYKERTCFLDISYHLFYILKDGDFAIQNNRFGAFFTQLFPLIGSKLGFSLTNIAILYSMSFVILPFLTFLLIHIGLKNSKISLCYLLFVILMTTHTFYWIQSELPQALAFLFILITLIDNIIYIKKEFSPFYWVFICILSFIVSYTHPLILFPVSYFIIYYYITHLKNRKLIASIGLIFYSFFIIKSIFFKNSHDSQAIDRINQFVTLFPNYINLQSNNNLLKYFINDYYFVVLLLIVTSVYFLLKQRYDKFVLLIGFFFGYSLVVNVSYPNGADQFYLENQYLILSFIVTLPFVIDFLPELKNFNFQLFIIFLLCIVGLKRIFKTHNFYSDRLDWNRKLISQSDGFSNKKIIFGANKASLDKILMSWGTSYEIWLLSTIENGESRSIIFEEKEGEFDWALPSKNSFITKWGYFYYSDLNKKYFIFSDTTEYIKIK